ncbi:hypothetical protein Pelo_5410 [Pelomyxa schiedti]|nr:hypothetical protein Pelo_5410 [Pelomyxa schiedti]
MHAVKARNVRFSTRNLLGVPVGNAIPQYPFCDAIMAPPCRILLYLMNTLLGLIKLAFHCSCVIPGAMIAKNLHNYNEKVREVKFHINLFLCCCDVVPHSNYTCTQGEKEKEKEKK